MTERRLLDQLFFYFQQLKLTKSYDPISLYQSQARVRGAGIIMIEILVYPDKIIRLIVSAALYRRYIKGFLPLLFPSQVYGLVALSFLRVSRNPTFLYSHSQLDSLVYILLPFS
ncbi:hypothetical protein M422DRAFT_35517 [Sphaerobolus stellatus SS14]|uniref:Uncharacterized protein n=1 Tax=Sphaerobolus stellatus (strain SS14) TaxID=990650 RepID=A0A0C9UW03_SPHS4|nr:hypothetical protein M422DRAFT_36156 [Sphaerobolus stellatus SS14]KIJ33412.1 hypothetical protein M422DRAFT_35517 [Sphaerobolus stellatus SS14]